MTYESAKIDIIFTHVEAAVGCLKAGETDKALRLLEMVRGLIAAEAIKNGNSDVGSIHYHNILDVLIEKYPREVDE